MMNYTCLKSHNGDSMVGVIKYWVTDSRDLSPSLSLSLILSLGPILYLIPICMISSKNLVEDCFVFDSCVSCNSSSEKSYCVV